MKLSLADYTLVSASSRNIKPMVVSTPGLTYRLAHFHGYYCSSEEVFSDLLVHILHLCCFLVFGKRAMKRPYHFVLPFYMPNRLVAYIGIVMGLYCDQLRGWRGWLSQDFVMTRCWSLCWLFLFLKFDHSFIQKTTFSLLFSQQKSKRFFLVSCKQKDSIRLVDCLESEQSRTYTPRTWIIPMKIVGPYF